MHLPSQMLTGLHMETRALHPGADAPWVELMSIEATRERYVSTLLAMYGFEAPIESAVALTPGMNSVIQLRQRARTGFIVQDLLALGFTPSRIARLPQCGRVVAFRDSPEALGWLYVVERSTLLHNTVRHHLEARLPNVNAWSYLSAYDGVASLRWHELGQALDFVATTTETGGDQIVANARQAFTTLHEWIANEETEQHAILDARAHSVRPGASERP